MRVALLLVSCIALAEAATLRKRQCRASSASPHTFAQAVGSSSSTSAVNSSPSTTSTTESSTPSSSSEKAASTSTSSGTNSGTSDSSYSPTTGIYSLNSPVSAIATTYGGNWGGGTCSFSDYPHTDVPNGVALGKEQWFGAAGCGSCVKITGASGSVVAMVNDQCPECVDNHLDLDRAYASQVDADFDTKGIFDITWEFVPCTVSGNLQFKNKEGSSGYYFALQVRNSVLPVDKLEVSQNGNWVAVERAEYNYFTSYSGFGDEVDIRITSSTGQQIVENGVKVTDGGIVQGSSQFTS